VTKPISARVHGVLDYATVVGFLNAPMVFGFHGTPAVIVYWLAGIHSVQDPRRDRVGGGHISRRRAVDLRIWG